MIFDRLLKRREGRIPSTPSLSTLKLVQEGAENGEIDDGFLSRLRGVSLASQRKLASGITGEHPSPRRAHALEFADYRSYTPGDDFRRVDWNAYLRLDHLLVKLADAPERVTLHVLLDASRSMAWGTPDKFGYARRVAAGLAYVALAHMDAATLIVLSGQQHHRLSHQKSGAAIASMVRALNSLQPDGSTDLDTALTGYTTVAHHRGVAVLISDLLSPQGYQSGLERLSRAALRPVVIHILSPQEMRPTMEGDLELEDVETGDTVQVSVDWGILRRYQHWLQDWLAEVERFCSSRGITYVRVETTQPVEQLLLDRLRRERVLK